MQLNSHAIHRGRPVCVERIKLCCLSPSVVPAWVIRESRPSDACELSAIDIECHGEGSGGWSAGVFQSTMSHAHATVLIASCSSSSPESLAGFISGIFVGQELQVENMAVRQRHRGRGLGQLLLQSLLARHGIQPIGIGQRVADDISKPPSLETGQGELPICLLEVKEGNGAALQLYKKLGFRVVGRRKNFYPDGSAGLLMELSEKHFLQDFSVEGH